MDSREAAVSRPRAIALRNPDPMQEMKSASLPPENQAVPLTGPVPGTGAAAAQAFARAGAAVARTGVNGHGVRVVAHESQAIECVAGWTRGDVGNSGAVEAMVASTVEGLDGVLPNAGVQITCADATAVMPWDADRAHLINRCDSWARRTCESDQVRRQGSGIAADGLSLRGPGCDTKRGIIRTAEHVVLGLIRDATPEYAVCHILHIVAPHPERIRAPMANQGGATSPSAAPGAIAPCGSRQASWTGWRHCRRRAATVQLQPPGARPAPPSRRVGMRAWPSGARRPSAPAVTAGRRSVTPDGPAVPGVVDTFQPGNIPHA